MFLLYIIIIFDYFCQETLTCASICLAAEMDLRKYSVPLSFTCTSVEFRTTCTRQQMMCWTYYLTFYIQCK